MSSSGRAGKMPNILMLVVDQLRADCVGYADAYPVRTPHIDRLAASGTSFSSAYTPVPTCCPARQALLAGRRPETFGGLWNYDLGSAIPALPLSVATWSQHLHGAGFRSAYLGKWHVNPDHDPTRFGFDEYVPEQAYEDFLRRQHPGLEYRNGYFGEPDPLPLEDTHTHWFAQRAIEKLEQFSTGASPWLLRLDLVEPHLPCRPQARFASLFDPSTIPRWAGFAESFAGKPYIQKQQLVNWRIEDYDWEDWAPIVARYYAVIAQLDDAIGRVLEALQRLGLAEDTIVVFTSDHGDMCGSHRMMDKHYVLYDDVVRVPLIVRVPGLRPGRSDAFVYNMLDLPPTLFELLGMPVPDWMQGRSLVPVLSGNVPQDWRQSVVSTYNGQQFGLYSQRMLRTRYWKYVWNGTDIDELYDLRSDPGELINLVAQPEQASRLARMRRELHETLVREGDTLMMNQWLSDQLLNSRKLAFRCPA